MAQLPIKQAVPRFQENEDRVNIFVNAPTGEDYYTTSEGENVKTLPKLVIDAEQAIQDVIDSGIGTGVIHHQMITTDGVSSTYPLTFDPIHSGNIIVNDNGIVQKQDSYSVVGTDLVFNYVPSAGVDRIEVLVFDTVPLGETDASQVSFTRGNGTETTVQTAVTETIDKLTFYAPDRAAAEILAADLGDGATIWIDSDAGYIGGRTRNTVVGGMLTDSVVDTAAVINYQVTGGFARNVAGKFGESVSVLDFIPEAEHAAIRAGTSTYNCTNAIKTALNSASRVIINGGVLNVDLNQISVPGSVKVIEFIGATLKVIESSITSSSCFRLQGSVNGLVISNLSIDLNYSSTTFQPQAVYLQGAKNVILNYPTIRNSGVTTTWPGSTGWGYGVYLQGDCENIYIIKPSMDDLRYGVITNKFVPCQMKNIKILGGEFNNISGDPIEWDFGAPGCYGSDLTVDDVRIFRCGDGDPVRGLGVGASGLRSDIGAVNNLKVINSTFIECLTDGVHIENGVTNAVVADNYFERCGEITVSNGSSISVYTTEVGGAESVSDIVISNNIVKGTALATYGIAVGGTVKTSKVTITGNNVSGISKASTGRGIVAGSVNSHVICNDNIVSGCTTPILYSAESGSCDGNIVTGNTNGILIGPRATGAVRNNTSVANTNIGYVTTGASVPVVVQNHTETQTGISAGAAAYSPWVNMLPLGTYANGTIVLRFWRAGSEAVGVYGFTWDGTTLALTRIKTNTSGALGLAGTASSNLQMSGSTLQARVYYSGSAVSDLSCQVSIIGFMYVG